MQRTVTRLLLAVLGSILLPAAVLRAAPPSSPRMVLDADTNWHFFLGDPTEAEKQTFSDAAWRTVTLPHDWSIEGNTDEKNPTGSGGGYFPAGIGWYRKSFTAPPEWKDKQVSIEFEGVAANATVYLNGEKLGIHPYAYTSFRFDLTPHLKIAARNVLAVRVDNSLQPASRWYTGAGIYRHVRVIATNPVHVAPWGVFVSTPEATDTQAKVQVRTQLQNDSGAAADITLRTTLLSSSGEALGKEESKVHLESKAHADTPQLVLLKNPKLWSPQSPTLYRAVTEILSGERVLDRVETTFGVRTLSWSVDKGLLLNGKSIKLVGGSVHHDNGPLGAAAFDRAEERRVELLKAAGFNAVRTAHNPPSPAFLDACDRLGLLVLDEPFDVWTIKKAKYDYARFFNDWWQQDIDSMVLRDRNHPAIIFWGIGNEIPEVWMKEGAPLARQLAARVRSLDTTRPLTQAFPGATFGPNPDAAISQVDIAGYNYNLGANGGKDHERVPSRIMMTTESVPASAFEQWQLAHDHSYMLGEFVWTAMDYLGESGIGSWSYATPEQAEKATFAQQMMKQMMGNMGADGKNPFEAFEQQANAKPDPTMAFLFPGYPWHAANSGDLDLTGFRKPISYYRDILWNGGERVYATVRFPEPEGKKIVAIGWSMYPSLPSWTWPGQEGKNLEVEVYSGTEKVRLYLNDKLIGEKPTTKEQESKTVFSVPYAPGTLKVVGLNGDREVAHTVLQTAGAPAKLRLTADRKTIQADGEDLSFITIEALDSEGRLILSADQEVHFTIDGPGTILAVGNGDAASKESYQGNQRALFRGRALVVIRSSRDPGVIHLRANTDKLGSSEITINASASQPRSELKD